MSDAIAEIGHDAIRPPEIDTYVEQIIASGALGKSARRGILLKHLLMSEVGGNGSDLKAYSLGIDVFNKPEDFDPTMDSTVRVEMGRLRAAVEKFEAGQPDTILSVEIPVGTYRPVIALRNPAARTPTGIATPRPGGRHPMALLILFAVAIVLGAIWVTVWMTLFGERPDDTADNSAAPSFIGVQVLPFQGPTDLTDAVESGLRQALSRSPTVRLLEPLANDGIHRETAFAITGLVTDAARGTAITVRLISTETDEILWSGTVTDDGLLPLMEFARQRLGADLRIRVYGAAKTVLAQFNPDDLTEEELFVLATWVPGPALSSLAWEQERLALIYRALEIDPDYGPAHSVAADKLTYLANLYAHLDDPSVHEAAIGHARRAMQLSPLDADVVFNVAQSQWHAGYLSDSIRTMNRVIELDPSHEIARFLAFTMPYTCATAPDEILARAIAFDAALEPDNPIRWLTLTWIGRLHAFRGEWDEALRAEEAAALIFELPYTFMRHAMILSRLDRIEDAAALLDAQTDTWPGFQPSHFSEVTIPRICRESAEADRLIGYYAELAEDFSSRN